MKRSAAPVGSDANGIALEIRRTFARVRRLARRWACDGTPSDSDAADRREPTESESTADRETMGGAEASDGGTRSRGDAAGARACECKSMADFVLETGYTPEQFVLKLLRERDGRVRQQAVLSASGWSRSTTSRVLGRLEERDEVVRVRVGTENVVYLPEALPDAAESFDAPSVEVPKATE
ncbi:helix-turn-helix transcriptional regulator [Halomicrococcus sp. NG-SE-24]|uniref:helix-turn-helix transcriptional regulator n=1 Tax=Halomicrococcus sp. NG-SE-24 TaxID=3436928 RepID=UPI003D98FD64